jgi:tripartite-type tricarboxylate transporter receptor subunit TctC
MVRGQVMNFARRQFDRLGAAVVAVTLLTLSGHGAWSQATRTIKVVVPTAPGGSLDFVARLLSEQIGRAQGQTMVVEDRPGAGNLIGTDAVARAAPDGNTLLFNANAFVIDPHMRKVNYDPLTSFEPICQLVNTPTVLVVNNASPYHTLVDLLNAARAMPGALTLASFGPESPYQIGFEILKRAANVDMTFIPYSGGPPILNALMGEHVTSAFITYATVADLLKAGKLRALASASPTRIEPLPNVPTIAESGYKDYEINTWFGVVAPAKTPKERISQLAGWFSAAMKIPEIKAKFAVQGLYPVGICGADFGAFIRKQYDEYGRVIREANIKAE